MEKKIRPPRLPRRILALFLSSEEKSTLLTDLDEYFHEVVKGKSRFISWCWYWRQVLGSILSLAKKSFSWGGIMLKNYFVIALRNIRRNKVYSFLNMGGLAVGMASFILISLFIRYQLSYDRYHENAGRIYRVATESQMHGTTTALSANPMAPELVREFPEIVHAVRIDHVNQKVLIEYGHKYFKEERFYLSDPNVFKVFSFPLIKGNPDSALKEKYSVVISATIASKYFGDDDPVGKILHFENKLDFQVTGVMKDIPLNSHFRCDFLASFACADEVCWKGYAEDKTQKSLHTYILLREGTSSSELEKKLPAFVSRFLAPVLEEYAPMKDKIPGGLENMKFKLFLQPLTRIHLHSDLFAELSPNYDIRYIYIFSAIGIFILLIACINFMNLSTAYSSKRSKEVGLRKVLGAQRTQLIKQFIAESMLMSFISLCLALIMVEFLLPVFNSFMGGNLVSSSYKSWSVFWGLIVLTVLVGVASGSYPAFFVSAFRPVKVLRGTFRLGTKSHFRGILVVTQFMITVGLIFSTIVMTGQLNYIRNKRLGFRKEQVIVVPLESETEIRNYLGFKNELLKFADIEEVTGASNVFTRIYSSSPFWWEGAQENESKRVQKLFVDYDFIKTFGIEITEGRDFSKRMASDRFSAFIINESAAQAFGWTSPLGKQIAWAHRRNMKGTVIGVIKDFHFRSLHQSIEPLILLVRSNNLRNMFIKINSRNIPQSLASIKNKWEEFFPTGPFEYFFLDDDINRMYASEMRMSQMFRYTALLAIFIACLGLFGLISYTTEQRTREVGVRKVLGASVPSIVRLLSGEFLKLVIIANILTWPLAYYAMNRWLQNFAYRITIGFASFILTAVLAFTVAIITVSFQSIRAALANPVESLRYE
jgi:putative ABC transport system permease protein